MNPRIAPTLFLSLLLTVGGSAVAQAPFIDNFEASTINPLLWTIADQSGSGSVNLDTAFVYSGTQSVQVNTDSFGGVEALSHSFKSPLYGSVSVQVHYSNTTGTGYKQMDIFEGAGFSSSDYLVYIDWGDLQTYVRDSSGATTLLLPPQSDDSWHKWTFTSISGEVTIKIDREKVFTQRVAFPFQTVNLQQCCLAGSAFFDDFSFTPMGNGVDVSYSYCPGDPDVWTNMKGDGVQFVMSEAWTGIAANQQKFPPCPQDQLPAAQASGLTTGAYAFLNFTEGYPYGNGALQIAKAIDAVCAPGKPPCAAFTNLKVVALDIEPCCGETFGNGGNALRVSDRIDMIVEAVGAIQNEQKKPVIYTTRGYWSQFTHDCQQGTNAACTNLTNTVPLWDTESDTTFEVADGSLHCGDGISGTLSFQKYNGGIGGWQARSGNQYDLGLSPGCSGDPTTIFGGTYGDVDLDFFDLAIFQ